MVEKISGVKNPLSIIAIFAGISEISGTIILPFIDKENQATYIWFLMYFPVGLVVLFFGTLWFKHKVLYAPSDFQNEENFFKSLIPASQEEKNQKIIEESEQVSPPQGNSITPKFSVGNFRENYRSAEDWVCQDISREFSTAVSRDVRIAEIKDNMVFDGVFSVGPTMHIIEVKYVRSSLIMYDSVYRMIHALLTAPEGLRSNVKIILAFVMDNADNFEEQNRQIDKLKIRFESALIPMMIKVYKFEELKSKYANK